MKRSMTYNLLPGISDKDSESSSLEFSENHFELIDMARLKFDDVSNFE